MTEVRLERLDGTEIADVRWRVWVDAQAAFVIGFQRTAMLDDRVYLTLAPGAGLRNVPRGGWRKLRQLLEEFPAATLFCQVHSDDEVAKRFVRFFGFEPVSEGLGLITYERRAP